MEGAGLLEIVALRDYLMIQSGVTARAIAPRYIRQHAVSLQPSPSYLVLKQDVSRAEGAGEIFRGSWPKLEPCRCAAADGGILGINNSICKAADARYDRHRPIPQGAKLS